MRGKRFAEAFRIQPPNSWTPPTRVSAGAWLPAAQSNLLITATEPEPVVVAVAFVAVAKPCLCLCFGTLSHTTYSRPFRFTILHASHRRLIAERTCGGDGVERVEGEGRQGAIASGGKATRDPAMLGGGVHGTTGRDGTRASGAARRAGAGRERTFIAALAVARKPRARASTPAARLSE